MAAAADIQQQVFDLLARASNISFVTADQGTGEVSFLTPGQRVNAEVLSLLPNNRVQVRVGVERFNLDLPMAVRTGQTLEMTFVSSAPRSTFAIARQAAVAPPISLSDASRLLSILITSEQIIDPQLRTSLQSIGDLLRRSSGAPPVLANLLDEALIYSSGRDGVPPRGAATQGSPAGGAGTGTVRLTSDQARLTAFETNASQLLRNIAQSARFTLIEAATHPVTSLPLMPGEEINATVVGTLAGGRALVQVAGTTLELLIAHKVAPGEILRLTYLSAEPKPTFALGRAAPEISPPLLSEAGRWLSVLEHSEGGVSRQQAYVLERLNTVLKSLPPGSPAFSVISDEALTYQRTARPPSEASISGTAQGGALPGAAAGNGVVLSDDMAKLLQAVIKGNRLALLESLHPHGPAGSFMPGQQVRGEVMAALGGGRFTVQVAGQSLDFIMPKGVRRGDQINLFFITDEPQQTFLMARFGRSGDAKVSDTSRWLSGFLGEASGQVPVQATLGLLRTLLSGPTTDAQLLGKALQQGLRESGLFYESHLARWFSGSYPLEDILREPQGRLSPHKTQAGTPDVVTAEELVRASIRTGSTDIMEAVFKKAGSSMAHEGIADQRALPIVSEQLSTLQNGHLLFRGDLFPGQQLEWTISEREAGRNRSGKRERSWETRVTLNLPNLGPVTALLALDESGVAVTISAEKGDAVPILETGRGRLMEQLEAAGLTAAAMSIGYATA